MTSITWAGPRCVQEAAAILGPQNRIQGRCGGQFAHEVPLVWQDTMNGSCSLLSCMFALRHSPGCCIIILAQWVASPSLSAHFILLPGTNWHYSTYFYWSLAFCDKTSQDHTRMTSECAYGIKNTPCLMHSVLVWGWGWWRTARARVMGGCCGPSPSAGSWSPGHHRSQASSENANCVMIWCDVSQPSPGPGVPQQCRVSQFRRRSSCLPSLGPYSPPHKLSLGKYWLGQEEKFY